MTRNVDLSSSGRDNLQQHTESVGQSQIMNQSGIQDTNEESYDNDASQSILVDDSNPIIKLSRRRWAILFAMTVFNLCSAFTDTQAPILHTMLNVVDLPMKEFVLISQVMSFVPIVSSTPTAWVVDRYGIRVAMFVATGFMMVRNSFWALLFYPDLPYWNHFKRGYWIIAGLAASQVSTIYYTLPLKTSELWFGVSERSFAWTIMISCGGIGSSLASFLYPMYIDTVSRVKYLAYVSIICAIVSAISVFVGFTKDKPNHPTSDRMIKQNSKPIPFKDSIKKILLSKDVILQILHNNIVMSVVLTVSTVFEDIVTSSGRSEVYAGSLVSLNSIVSLVSIIAFSTLVHRMTNITLTCKMATTLTTVTYVAYLASVLSPSSPGWLILSLLILYSLCESWKAPNFNNILVHITCGAVSHATLVGFSITGFILVYNVIQLIFVELIRPTSGTKSDYTASMIFIVAVAVINNLVYLIFFTGKPAKSDIEE